MNVKVTLGKTFNAFQEKNNENVTKISRLEGIVFEKEKEIAELKSEINSNKQSINLYHSKLLSADNEREQLKSQIESLLGNQERLNQLIINFNNSQTDLSDSNKKLQRQVEILNNEIEEKDKKIIHQADEYAEMEKIKNNFEEKMIILSCQLDQSKSKILSLENIIKQKDRYIQMLVNEKKSTNNSKISNTNSSNTINRVSSNKTVSSFQIGSEAYLPCNTMNLKSQLTEKDSYIKKLEDKIKKIENDNNNLIIRLRNKK